jgi:hypothetical protein
MLAENVFAMVLYQAVKILELCEPSNCFVRERHVAFFLVPTLARRKPVSLFTNTRDRVARPSRQGGRVAQRQEAAPCALFVWNGVIYTFRLQAGCPNGVRSMDSGPHGAASCRCATRPVLRTRPGHPVGSHAEQERNGSGFVIRHLGTTTLTLAGNPTP